MKKALIFFYSVILLNSINAQDTIHKVNGDLIIAKITEITPSEIKYKRYGFQDGPTYIELKSNVDMLIYVNGVKEVFKKVVSENNQTILTNKNNEYKAPVNPDRQIEIRGNKFLYNGSMHSERNIQQLLMDTKNKSIMGYVAKAKQAQKIQFVGFAAIPLGIAGLFSLASATRTTVTYDPATGMSDYSTKTNPNLITMGVICISGAITCPIVSGVFKHKRKSYNREAIELYNEKY